MRNRYFGGVSESHDKEVGEARVVYDRNCGASRKTVRESYEMLSEVLVVESSPPLFPQVVNLLKEHGYVVHPVNRVQLAVAVAVATVVILNVNVTPAVREEILAEVRHASDDVITLDLLRGDDATSSADAFLREPFTIADLSRLIEFLALDEGPAPP